MYLVSICLLQNYAIFEVLLLPQVGGSYALNETRLRSFGVIVMKKYLNAVSEKQRELEALFSLQKLVSSLEHPNKHKLLHSIFDIRHPLSSLRTRSWSGK